MEATIPGPNLAFPLLSMQIEIGGRGDLGEELRRREPLGRPPDLRRAVALRHPQGVVDDRGGVDLHGDRIGIGGVQAIEIEHFLEIEEHPLDAPAVGVQVQRFFGAQARGREHVGEHLVARAAAAPADVAQQLARGGGPGTGAHQPVLEHPAVDPAFAQALQLVQAQLPIAPDDPPALLAAQGREEVGGAVEAIAQHERVAAEGGQGGFRARHLAGRGIGREGQLPAQAAPQIVDAEQTARQHHRALVPQQLEPMRDGRQAGPVEDHDGGEPGAHRRHLGGVARGHRATSRVVNRWKTSAKKAGRRSRQR